MCIPVLQLKHCCVEDPSDICTININGLQMCEATTDDFAMFDSVAYVNAGENYLPFGEFILRDKKTLYSSVVMY